MKYRKVLYDFLNELTYHLKWNIQIINSKYGMYAYDYDNHCKQSISSLIKDIIDNGYIEDLGYHNHDIEFLKGFMYVR